jgi:glycosyltransferase involved in cell wall biosynthesis
MPANMSDKLVTIITVTKNCAATLAQTLDTILAIKTEAVEYLVIDGLSVDGTLSVIRQYDHIVDGLLSEADCGIYQAMNKGVARATGKYVLFINGDDGIEPEGFHLTLDYLKCHDVDIACAQTVVRATNERLVAKPWQLLFFNSIPHPSSFVKTEILLANKFREDLKIAADYDFFLRAYLIGHTFSLIPLITAFHTRGGASSDTAQSIIEINLIRKHRLGWRRFLLNAVHQVYHFGKVGFSHVRFKN